MKLADAREWLNRFIHHPWTDGTIMALIVVSVALIVVELTTVPDTLVHNLAVDAGHGLTWVFIAELLLRFAVAQNKRRFFRQYWLDIIAVIPFARSLRFLRLLRLLRIFRLGLLVNRRLANFSAIFRGATGEFLIIVTIIVITILFGAFGLRLTEGVSNPGFATFDQTLWWSVLSLVAGEPIGDTPVTPLGRIFALIVMMSGLTVFAMFTGTVSAVMVGRLRNLNVNEMDLDELRQHIVICGWNRSGRVLLDELAVDREAVSHGIVICAEFDQEPNLDNLDIDRNLVFVVRADYTRIDTLRRCGIPEAAVAIILADRTRERSDQDRDARSVLAAITIERMNDGIFTSVELINRENGAHLRMIGVEEIVVAEEYAGNMMAMTTRNRGIVALVEELLSTRHGNSFHKVRPPRRLIGKTVREIGNFLRDEHDAVLVAVERERPGQSDEVFCNPRGDKIIEADDHVVVIARQMPRLER